MPPFNIQPYPNRKGYACFGYALSDELQEIPRERAVELACKSFRYDDWRRWAAGALFQGKKPFEFPYLASEYSPSFKIPLSNGFFDPFQKLLPSRYNFNADRDYLDCVPVNEITLNANLWPNPVR